MWASHQPRTGSAPQLFSKLVTQKSNTSTLKLQSNAQPMSGNNSLTRSNCESAHLLKKNRTQLYDVIKAAFGNYYSLDRFTLMRGGEKSN